MDNPFVTIFLATYNGQAYLEAQLQSFSAQSYLFWRLHVSDDGSSDQTMSLLKAHQHRLGQDLMSIHAGPHRGYAANFLSMVCADDAKSAYYAYSDQDDVWFSDKLERAVAWLRTVPENMPALYCGRTEVVSQEGSFLGYSTLFQKKISFLNALVQNIGGGNTMVFNQAALNLLRKAGAELDVMGHDWWTYLMVTGCGGVVYFDPKPTLQYRQHAHSLLGENISWSARWTRIRMLWQGHFKHWNDQNCSALQTIEPLLTKNNRRIFQKFMRARSSSFFVRLFYMQRLGVYRQTWLGQMGLMMATVLDKL